MLHIVMQIGNQDIELGFLELRLECLNSLCGKSFDLVSGRGPNKEGVAECALGVSSGIPEMVFSDDAICPFCAEKTRYRITLSFLRNQLQFASSSNNIIALVLNTTLGEIKHYRSLDPTDDPNFNFVENINKGSSAYFYNFENHTAKVEILYGTFLKAGTFCIGVFDPETSELVEPAGIFGPAVVLNHGVILVNNKTAVACEAIYDEDGNQISPHPDASTFKDRVVLCFKNSPSWTRRRQSPLV